MSRLGRSVARMLLAGMFVYSGQEVARDPGPRPKLAAEVGVPQPELAVRLNGAAMAAGGLALSLGIAERYAAGLLAALLVPTTYAGHRFWEIGDDATKRAQRTHFLKNLSMLGGLLYVASGPGD